MVLSVVCASAFAYAQPFRPIAFVSSVGNGITLAQAQKKTAKSCERKCDETCESKGSYAKDTCKRMCMGACK